MKWTFRRKLFNLTQNSLSIQKNLAFSANQQNTENHVAHGVGLWT